LKEREVQKKEVDDTMALFLHHLTTHEGGKREQKSALQAVQEVYNFLFLPFKTKYI